MPDEARPDGWQEDIASSKAQQRGARDGRHSTGQHAPPHHMPAMMRSMLRSANAAVDSAGLATSESGNKDESITNMPG